MKRALAEKIGVVVMFALVLAVFSFAERDTKKLIRKHAATASKPSAPSTDLITSETAAPEERVVLSKK